MLITIGAFDGFHIGHAKLLSICRENAINNDWGVVTFSPHPSEFMNKLERLLFTLKEREFIGKILGIPRICVLKFDDAFCRLSPEAFWRLLRDKIEIDGLVLGRDFRFGHSRSGDADLLRSIAINDGISPSRIFIVDLFEKSRYSSSGIREKIRLGDVNGASKILGYNWFILSKVIHGKERGRTMNFPTANLKIEPNKILPRDGVYSVAVNVNNSWHCGALSVGINPTFRHSGQVHPVNELSVEVYILDFNAEIYDSEILVSFLERIRDIKTFADKNELAEQIKLDIDLCRKIYEKNVNRHTLSYKF